jgi:hypothetical protein
MKKTLLALAILGFSANSFAVDHSMHGGGTGSSGSSSSINCSKATFSKFQPEHLATVTPESDFSFIAFNVQKPEQIEVTVKSQPVKISVENTDSFMRVTGKLPADLKNTAARINIKATTKVEKCNGEGGWLVTITE